MKTQTLEDLKKSNRRIIENGYKGILSPEQKVWNCRFHPTDWWHEVGCPHCKWNGNKIVEHITNSQPTNEK